MTRAVLFDLDGTFADTAPDLGYALNLMREARQLPPIPLERTRPVTSTGARGMLSVGFGISPEHPDYAAMRDEFLNRYEQNLCRSTCVFPGTDELLAGIDARGLKWGIVTNKAERFAVPLMRLLGLSERCGCLIGGDTTGKTKPAPDPLWAGCRVLGIAPEDCIYVGDDERDIVAAHAAGMRGIAVRYGYLNGSSPDAWGADAVVDHPPEILQHL